MGNLYNTHTMNDEIRIFFSKNIKGIRKYFISMYRTDKLNNLLSTNLGDDELREKRRILLTGTCIMRRFPDILEDFLKKLNSPAHMHICLETYHMDQVGYKLTLMIKYSNIEELTVLTIDGSPHCLQLHYLAEDQRYFYPDLQISHFVIEKGIVYEIDPKAVKISRHLHKVQKLIKEKNE